MRYLILMVLALVAYGLWRQMKRKSTPPKRPAPKKEEAMVACAHCGVYAPASEMVSDAAGRRYCSAKHKKLGVRS
jgi:uncharacterized protein